MFAGNGYADLSEMALYYIGGIIKHAKALNAFTNPSTNSYKRLIPGFEAPVLLAYSARNRSASCRIPYVASPKGKRVEVRFPDPPAQPVPRLRRHADGRPGRHPEQDPSRRADGQEPVRPAAGRAERGPDRVRFAAQALDSLEADNDFLIKGDVFTPNMIEAYIELKCGRDQRLREHRRTRSSTRCTTRSDPTGFDRSFFGQVEWGGGFPPPLFFCAQPRNFSSKFYPRL